VQAELSNTDETDLGRGEVRERVLVIDDDPGTLALVARSLVEHGYNPLLAENGLEGLKLFRQHEPRLVVCDWLMPGMDGLEICRELKTDGAHGLVYVIMFTIQSSESRVVEAFDTGVDDFLRKPFTEGELVARIRAGGRIVRLYDERTAQLAAARRANVELSRLNRRLEELATTDELTGLLNRRQALSKLYEYVAVARRYQQRFSCAAIDVDNFKEINDEYGHIKGDEVLQRIGAVLCESVRSMDVVCRVGGDEFLVIFPNQISENAAIGAEGCRTAVASKVSVECKPVGISIGVAHFAEDMTHPSDVLRAADKALYDAKRAGKNVVVAARAAQHASERT